MDSEQWNSICMSLNALWMLLGCIAIIVVITYFAVKIGQNNDDWPAY